MCQSFYFFIVMTFLWSVELEIYRTRPQYVLLWHHCRGRSFFSNMLNCYFHTLLFDGPVMGWQHPEPICCLPIFRNCARFQKLLLFSNIWHVHAWAVLRLYCLSSRCFCARGKGGFHFQASTKFRCSRVGIISNVFHSSGSQKFSRFSVTSNLWSHT